MIELVAPDGLVAPLRVACFRGRDDFEDHRRREAAREAVRREADEALAARDPAAALPGTCALCLAPTLFTPGPGAAALTASGRDGRKAMACGCRRGLTCRDRMLLHLLLAGGLLRPWMRVHLAGDAGGLREMVEALAPASGRPLHLFVSVDQFRAGGVPPRLLAEIAALLVPGGSLVVTMAEPDWGLLDLLPAAGFSEATALAVWSAEFGYPGENNLVFTAAR